jgi:hypothetical protein
MAYSIIEVGQKVALPRVRRLAHSLKRDIDVTAVDEDHRHGDSPMSMTQPTTTLTRGQNAPVLHRSSAAPYSTLPQCRRTVFLRRDLRQWADYFANHSIEGTNNGGSSLGFLSKLVPPSFAPHVKR